jgi:hypothetical protein
MLKILIRLSLYRKGFLMKIVLSLLFTVFCLSASAAEISGEVTLAKGVTLKPGGVLFIFAKKAGNPMPAAVLRVPEPKLPYKFSLSEKNAMVPGHPFDGPYTITARYSPTGDAMDKTGPEGIQDKPVAVGSKNVNVEMKAK